MLSFIFVPDWLSFFVLCFVLVFLVRFHSHPGHGRGAQKTGAGHACDDGRKSTGSHDVSPQARLRGKKSSSFIVFHGKILQQSFPQAGFKAKKNGVGGAMVRPVKP